MPKKTTKRTHLRTTEETRFKICEDYFARFLTVRKICQKYRMADTTVRGILERNRVEDRVAYKSRGGARNTIQFKPEHTAFIRDLVDEEDDQSMVSLEEIQQKLAEQFPADFPSEPTVSALQRHLNKNLQLTMKRVASVVPQLNMDLNSIHQYRIEYYSNLQANQLDYLTNCIFIDECEFNVSLVPARLRLKRGKKSETSLTKTRRGKTISVLGAVSPNRVEALQAIVVDRPSEHEIYDDFLVDLIKKMDTDYTEQNYVFIISNNVFHKSPKIQEILTTTSTRHNRFLILPMCSNLFSPMEACFQSLKNFVSRSPGDKKEDLFQMIKNAETNIPKEVCTEWVQDSANNVKKYLQGGFIAIV